MQCHVISSWVYFRDVYASPDEANLSTQKRPASDEATASTTTVACRHISTSSSSLKVTKYVTMDKYVKDADERYIVCTDRDFVNFVSCVTSWPRMKTLFNTRIPIDSINELQLHNTFKLTKYQLTNYASIFTRESTLNIITHCSLTVSHSKVT